MQTITRNIEINHSAGSAGSVISAGFSSSTACASTCPPVLKTYSHKQNSHPVTRFQ
jgi:hypothetical protein